MGKRQILEPEDRDRRFSRSVRALREELGLSQQDLAVKAGLSVGMVAKYEAATSQPTWPVALKIIEVLGVDVLDFANRGKDSEEAS